MTSTAPHAPCQASREMRRAVTLLVVVIVVLTALAGVPGAAPEVDDGLAARCAEVQEAVERYRRDHDGRAPGQASWSEFVRQLTTPTDADGRPGDAFGPYLSIDRLRGGGRLAGAALDAPDAECTWLWCPDDGRLAPNLAADAPTSAGY